MTVPQRAASVVVRYLHYIVCFAACHTLKDCASASSLVRYLQYSDCFAACHTLNDCTSANSQCSGPILTLYCLFCSMPYIKWLCFSEHAVSILVWYLHYIVCFAACHTLNDCASASSQCSGPILTLYCLFCSMPYIKWLCFSEQSVSWSDTYIILFVLQHVIH